VVALTTQTIEVTSYLWPAGIGLLSPTPAVPWWRTPAGERHSFGEVVAGARWEVIERLADAHVEAIGAILCGAVMAKGAGKVTEGRRLIAGASLLCEELHGPWGPGRRH
jgi:hypothetical protein